MQDKLKESVMDQIKENIIELGLSSTSHGIPNALKTKHKLIKFMW